MTVKCILALSLNPETNESTLACALIVARQFGAHIDVTHIKGRPQLVPGGGFDSYSGFISDDLWAKYEIKEQEREAQMRVAFDEFVRREDVTVRTTPEDIGAMSVSWNVVEGHAPDVVALQGGAYDLIVVGRPQNGATGPSRVTVESALFSTGRPVLIAPPDPPQTLGETVLIGWNRSAPAARAFHAAKALLLEGAKQVRLLSITTGAKTGPSAEDVAANLAWHGVQAEIREFSPDHRSVGAVLLAEASAISADLLVMGAYSHNRIRRMVLGGVTRHIITHATMPVFMAY